jgi:predicted metal-dependent hydrolase
LLHAPPTEEPVLQVDVAGHGTVDVAVRRSAQARYPRLRVREDAGAAIVLPERATLDEARKILADKAGWLQRKLDAVADRQDDDTLGMAGVWLDGAPLAVVRGPAGGRPIARLVEGELVVVGAAHDAEAAVMRWYRRQARAQLRAIVADEAARLGVQPAKVLIAGQRTRWGSCSATGTVSLNWRLVLAPRDVQRYLVVHELCHLRVADHARGFWRLLDGAMPGWRTHAEWLQRHGSELLRFAPNLPVDERDA